MKYIPDYSSRFRILKGGKISLVVSALLGSATILSASPSGGTVTSGSANIVQSGATTNITQSTDKASINWQNFSIGANETVNFNQPNVNSITLNRVVGNERSIIDGALNANGQVWILNSNGVLFNKSASINTAGLLATTKNISDAEFNAGNYNFKGESTAGVINMGTIEAKDSGYVALLANTVQNDGTIKAYKGTVHLTGASEATINLNGNSIVSLKVNKGVLDALVENKNIIQADGGKVYLTTNAVDEILKGVVNNTGVIEAKSLDDVSSEVILFAHGGTANIGGRIIADGGFVETSGKEFAIQKGAQVKAKEWLVDPVNIMIDSTLASTIGTALGSGDVTITTSGSNTPSTASGESGTSGYIFVNDNITWSTGSTLTLTANRNIYINSTIDATGGSGGKLILNYGQKSEADGNSYLYRINAPVKLQDGQNFSTKLGYDGVVNDFTVISAASVIQAINTDATSKAGKYALGSNVDLTGVAWTPIGSGVAFTGKFEGLGHTIAGLSLTGLLDMSNIPTAATNVGLFGFTYGASISNLIIQAPSIGGYVMYGGALAGIAGNTNIFNVQVTNPNISITNNVRNSGNMIGGLVGAARDGTVIKYSSVDGGSVSGNYWVGGLVGAVFYESSEIRYSHSTANVSGAYMDNGSGVGSYTGGLIGIMQGGIVQESYATGDVLGYNYAGGLVGYIVPAFGTVIIINSYARGNVTSIASGGSSMGGFIGMIDINYYDLNNYNVNISNSYSTGSVSGTTNNVGGFVGEKIDDSRIFISNNFWDMETSGKSAGSGIGGTQNQPLR